MRSKTQSGNDVLLPLLGMGLELLDHESADQVAELLVVFGEMKCSRLVAKSGSRTSAVVMAGRYRRGAKK